MVLLLLLLLPLLRHPRRHRPAGHTANTMLKSTTVLSFVYIDSCCINSTETSYINITLCFILFYDHLLRISGETIWWSQVFHRDQLKQLDGWQVLHSCHVLYGRRFPLSTHRHRSIHHSHLFRQHVYLITLDIIIKIEIFKIRICICYLNPLIQPNFT